ncbi:hypothetical protein Tco_0855363 [Tanacetum coccineum]
MSTNVAEGVSSSAGIGVSQTKSYANEHDSEQVDPNQTCKAIDSGCATDVTKSVPSDVSTRDDVSKNRVDMQVVVNNREGGCHGMGCNMPQINEGGYSTKDVNSANAFHAKPNTFASIVNSSNVGSGVGVDMAYPKYWIRRIGVSWSRDHARIRRIFLDGYGVLVVRIVIFKISSFKLQNACLLLIFTKYSVITAILKYKRLRFRTLVNDEKVDNSNCVLLQVAVNMVKKGLEQVVQRGPWMIRKSPIILTKWSSELSLKKGEVTCVLVWVKLHGVLILVYSGDGLSLIATQIGKPLLLDAFTSSMCVESRGRIGFSRALVEVRSNTKLKTEVIMVVPNEKGNGYTKEVIKVEYEWKPPHCVDYVLEEGSLWSRFKKAKEASTSKSKEQEKESDEDEVFMNDEYISSVGGGFTMDEDELDCYDGYEAQVYDLPEKMQAFCDDYDIRLC